jgi:hypothetical protein
MAIFLAYYPLGSRVGLKLFLCVGLFGIATCVFGLSKSVTLSVVALFILGASDMVSVYVRETLIQINTDDRMRGRVSAVSQVFIGASNELGEFESGLTASWFGPVPAVIIGGVGTCVIVGLFAWLFPQLRKADKLVKT